MIFLQKSLSELISLREKRMSFPDPTAPPHSYPYISPPFSGETPFWMGNDQQLQQHHHLDMMPQFDQSHPFKKARVSEKAPNFTPIPSMNPRMNPPSNKGTSHIFYKTRICAKFKEGTCRNGEHCTFAHGEEDLREPPPNWQDLIREKEREERGSGGGNWGDDQRMIHRMKICKKYYNGDECPYGDKCNFLHERPSPPMKKLKVDIPGQRESSAISIGTTVGDLEQTGFWKTRLCSKWEIGQCPFGERCHFAHGQSGIQLSTNCFFYFI